MPSGCKSSLHCDPTADAIELQQSGLLAGEEMRVRSSPRKRGSMITGRCSWIPALRPLARASAGTTAEEVRNERWRSFIVSGLLFTMILQLTRVGRTRHAKLKDTDDQKGVQS